VSNSSCNAGEGPSKRVQVERYCSTYSKIGHNSRTYTAEIKDISDSEGSSK
jgi:hypothetical protein